MPTCIGVVTSAEGAVWHDIQNVLRRRYPLVHLLLATTPVQGDRAPAGIVAALKALQDDGRPDVIIVARGGGSAEDLWSFNDERVVRAVFACPIPVVSGVGHETDWTLIDEVADLRAPTPSAAAELCSPSIVDLAARLVDFERHTSRLIHDRLDDASCNFQHLSARMERLSPRVRISLSRARLGTCRESIAQWHDQRIADARARVSEFRLHSRVSVRQSILKSQHSLDLEQARLTTLDPSGVLRRGYAHLTAGTDGRSISTVGGIAVGETFSARLVDGVVTGLVEGLARQTLASAGVPNRGE
jgi:exodeoxyribonuclease VII large subunit